LVRKSLVSTKGVASRWLEKRILEAVKGYERLTVRQLFYVLVSRYGYSLDRRFYKTLGYHLTKMRRLDVALNRKFVDYTRFFSTPPNPYSTVELWLEKDSLRSLVEDLAGDYRISLQVERGFGSLSMFRDALVRAKKRDIKRILYIGDWDPSGLLIEEITSEEMGVAVERIALTLAQIEAYRPPPRPVNPRDSRTPRYVQHHGSQCWEVEALEPKTFQSLVEQALKKYVPPEFLKEAEAKDRASAIVKLLTESLMNRLQQDALILFKKELPEEEILERLKGKYGL